MGYKNLMTAHAVIAIPMGLACAGAPAVLLANYGVSLPPMGLVIYQFWGVSLLGLGVLTWIIRASQEARIRERSSVALAGIHLMNCVLALRGQSAGANDFGWSTVALFLLLSLAFVYVRSVSLPRERSK